MFLLCARHKAGYIHKCDNREIERIAETDKAGSFFAGVNIKNTRQYLRLVCHEPNRMAAQMGKPNYNILGENLLNFVKLATIYHSMDNFLHIVRFLWIVWNNGIER